MFFLHNTQESQDIKAVHDRMDAVLPMKPLLAAPAATCVVAKSTCSTRARGGESVCAAIVSNTGKAAPCLYTHLELSDPTLPAGAPQVKDQVAVFPRAARLHAVCVFVVLGLG